MHTITLCYNPLDCTCWAMPPGEYCLYCNKVCDAALADYEAGVGDWAVFGCKGTTELAEEAKHEAALAEFFEEGRAPTPHAEEPQWESQGAHNLTPLTNFLQDLREEAPWQCPSGGRQGQDKKGKGRAKKPYGRPASLR
ncbi:hypothetical protein FRC08_017510 [Ceratobasidium sp. 394]|nr:hypothetical protein FRC08_017510 [Ceratobasidium sp. 394]KAG9093674.1 hypothetical protein FS749_013968 [Ceratobasidium sp. UAMH 11750]